MTKVEVHQHIVAAHDLTSAFVEKIRIGEASTNMLESLVREREHLLAGLAHHSLDQEQKCVIEKLGGLDVQILDWCESGQRQVLDQLRRVRSRRTASTRTPGLVSESA